MCARGSTPRASVPLIHVKPVRTYSIISNLYWTATDQITEFSSPLELISYIASGMSRCHLCEMSQYMKERESDPKLGSKR